MGHQSFGFLKFFAAAGKITQFSPETRGEPSVEGLSVGRGRGGGDADEIEAKECGSRFDASGEFSGGQEERPFGSTKKAPSYSSFFKYKVSPTEQRKAMRARARAGSFASGFPKKKTPAPKLVVSQEKRGH